MTSEEPTSLPIRVLSTANLRRRCGQQAPLWWVAEDAKRLETGERCNSSLQGREATSKVLTTNCWKRGKN
jgi:hypothetical protein